MALLDTYATVADYRDRVGDQMSGSQALLEAQLLSMSRLLERSLQVMPGAFNTHTGTYVFDSGGGSLLRLRDRAGLSYFLTAVTSIGIDSNHDGAFTGYTLTFANAWVRGLPENAAIFGEPYHTIEIMANITGANPSSWPLQSRVRIAGTFGWTTVPTVVKELVVHRTHDLRLAHLGGLTMQLAAIDGDNVPMSTQSAWLWREAESLYSRRVPVA